MKRDCITRTIAILVASLSGIASPRATAADSTEQWGTYELSLPGPHDGNPFVDVEFGATFSKDTKTIKVAGFYDGDGTYRVRFMPEATGDLGLSYHKQPAGTRKQIGRGKRRSSLNRQSRPRPGG